MSAKKEKPWWSSLLQNKSVPKKSRMRWLYSKSKIPPTPCWKESSLYRSCLKQNKRTCSIFTRAYWKWSILHQLQTTFTRFKDLTARFINKELDPPFLIYITKTSDKCWRKPLNKLTLKTTTRKSSWPTWIRSPMTLYQI